jgi:hypothetical protein
MSAPNLFNFATSELSQDAFLCWLISWAKPECKAFDENINNLAISFLSKLFNKHCKELTELRIIEIQKQYGVDNRIDIVVKINEQIILLIEDKVNTTEHSDQLPRYIAQSRHSDKLILPTYI